jgi:hypothetical protein
MICLTDDQTDAIVNTVRPLQAIDKLLLLGELLETLLAWRPGYAVGNADLMQELRKLQRKHFRYPTDCEAGVLGTRHHTRRLVE